ncbi:MAG: phytanoyl-CoA dioxygenase family protein [Enhydrobacter sp.]|nr:MAG: phytanoyl-CoA dioxygenase family protein [Enhydrobacter sp.]
MTEAPRLLALVRRREFWTQLAPDLGIGEEAVLRDAIPWSASALDPTTLRAQLDDQGYVHLPKVMEPELCGRLATAVAQLAALGIPPVFCMVYDLFWTPPFRLVRIVEEALGAPPRLLPAFWIWHVDPAKSERGWAPHRDVGHAALFADRRPKALTAWFAFSEANELNGCMHVVPADRDRYYGRPAGDGKTTDFAPSDVRALPAAAGDVFLWTQALLHWGGQSSPLAAGPRISLSIEFMHADEEPYARPPVEPAGIARLEDRLHLIARQILRYRHMYGLPPQLEALARAL